MKGSLVADPNNFFVSLFRTMRRLRSPDAAIDKPGSSQRRAALCRPQL